MLGTGNVAWVVCHRDVVSGRIVQFHQHSISVKIDATGDTIRFSRRSVFEHEHEARDAVDDFTRRHNIMRGT